MRGRRQEAPLEPMTTVTNLLQAGLQKRAEVQNRILSQRCSLMHRSSKAQKFLCLFTELRGREDHTNVQLRAKSRRRMAV